MKYTSKIPCEECISFAICYNRDTIFCKDLYDFICISKGDFIKYRRGTDIPVSIFELYGRYLESSRFYQYRVQLSTTKRAYTISLPHQQLLVYYRRNNDIKLLLRDKGPK
jgi:hypothetical protein